MICGLELEMWGQMVCELELEMWIWEKGLNKSGLLKDMYWCMDGSTEVHWVVGFQSHVSDLFQVGGRRGEVVCGSVNTSSLPSNPYLGLSQARW